MLARVNESILTEVFSLKRKIINFFSTVLRDIIEWNVILIYLSTSIVVPVITIDSRLKKKINKSNK